MGHAIEEIALKRGHEIVCRIDRDNTADFTSQAFAQADIAIEFTTPATAVDNYYKAFAAGKPVLHLCVIENDPALPYLARYPLALVLHQGQADAADILHRWLGEVCGKQLSFGEVCDLFPELVPQAVAAEFVRWLM